MPKLSEAQARVLTTMHNHKCLAYPRMGGAMVYDRNGPLDVAVGQWVFYSLVRQGFLFRRGPAFCLTDKGREVAKEAQDESPGSTAGT